MSVEVFNESGIPLPDLEERFAKILKSISEREKVTFGFVEVVFVDEEKIIEVNKEYLSKDYITDIISFHYHEKGEDIEGTLFCCAQQIKEQAEGLGEEFETELSRIFIHGCLHLIGYEDTTPIEKSAMTQKENEYLS